MDGATEAEYRTVFEQAVQNDGGIYDGTTHGPYIAADADACRHRARMMIAGVSNAKHVTDFGKMPDVYFDFVDNAELNAFAFTEDNKEFIGVNIGLLQLLKYYFWRILAHPGILPEIGDATKEEITSGLLLPRMISDYRDLEELGRSGVITPASPKDAVRRSYVSVLFWHAFEFVVAHEIQHLVNGHVSWMSGGNFSVRITELGLQSGTPISPLSNQALEMDADSSATGICFHHLRHEVTAARYRAISNRYGAPLENALFDWFFAVYSLFLLFDDRRSHENLGETYPTARLRQTMIITVLRRYLEQADEIDAAQNLRTIFVDVVTSAEAAVAMITGTDTYKRPAFAGRTPHLEAILSEWDTVVYCAGSP